MCIKEEEFVEPVQRPQIDEEKTGKRQLDLRLNYRESVESEGPLMALCPAHPDENSSLAIYKDHAYCFGCRKWWSANEFSLTYGQGSIKVSYQSKYHKGSRKLFLPRVLATKFSEWLQTVFVSKLSFFYERGFTNDTVRGLSFGYVPGAYTIPILGIKGNIQAIRYRRDEEYDFDEYVPPKYWGTAGANSTQLYLSDQLLLPQDEVYLCEGELDAARLFQQGLVAVSLTNGAGSFKPEHRKWFEDSGVVKICFDQDTAGNEGAEKVIGILGHNKAERVAWPLNYGKDVTEVIQNKGFDYFMGCVNAV